MRVSLLVTFLHGKVINQGSNKRITNVAFHGQRCQYALAIFNTMFFFLFHDKHFYNVLFVHLLIYLLHILEAEFVLLSVRNETIFLQNLRNI